MLQPVGLSLPLWVIKTINEAHFSATLTPASGVWVQKRNPDAAARLARAEPPPFVSVALMLCSESENSSSTVGSSSVRQYPLCRQEYKLNGVTIKGWKRLQR